MRVFSALALTAFVSCGAAEAAVIYNSDGHVSKMTKVEITLGGAPRLFDVDFIFGTYESVYGSATALPTGWEFFEANRAIAAGNGISEQLEDLNVSGTTLFAGAFGEPRIPYSVGPQPGAVAS